MNDSTVIQWASGVLREAELAHHVAKDGTRIEIVGVKRLSRFLPAIIPHLIGVKRTAATVVHEWITYRLTQPYHFVNYSDTDIEFVNRVRALNAGNGKDKMIPASILRDYTSRTRDKARAGHARPHKPRGPRAKI